MKHIFPKPRTIFHYLHPFRVLLLIFSCCIGSVVALHTCQCYLDSHEHIFLSGFHTVKCLFFYPEISFSFPTCFPDSRQSASVDQFLKYNLSSLFEQISMIMADNPAAFMQPDWGGILWQAD